MFQVGQELQGGRYRIERFLGRGGFGMTYEALHAELNTHFVLKTPDPTLQNDPEYTSYVKKFRQEGRLLAQLCQRCRHPHIVRVNDLFDEGDTPCLVMEFIPGENLFYLVRNRGKLPEAEAVQYIRQVASALEVVHREGIVHRDVHPGNIMLRLNGTEGNSVSAVLIDFGLAGEIVPRSVSSTLFGNEIFAPYELLRKRPGYNEPTVDIYTLAASLYYAVTGKEPTKAYDRRDGHKLIPPQTHVPSLSNELNRAIIAGMEFEANKRPASVSDWLALFPTQEDSAQVPPRYQKLRDLLKAYKWKEADEETARVMLQVARREKEGWLDIDSINNFPCEDLRAIDQLWVKYSNGRFGFSVQKRIWQEVGGKVDYETECRLGDRVGWRVKDEWLNYDDFTFSLNAPLGHLPVVRARVPGLRELVAFFSRVETCKLKPSIAVDFPPPKRIPLWLILGALAGLLATIVAGVAYFKPTASSSPSPTPEKSVTIDPTTPSTPTHTEPLEKLGKSPYQFTEPPEKPGKSP